MPPQVFQHGARWRRGVAVVIEGAAAAAATLWLLVLASALLPETRPLTLPDFVRAIERVAAPLSSGTERPQPAATPTAQPSPPPTPVPLPPLIAAPPAAPPAPALAPPPSPSPSPAATETPPPAAPIAAARTAAANRPTSTGGPPAIFPGRTPPPHPTLQPR